MDFFFHYLKVLLVGALTFMVGTVAVTSLTGRALYILLLTALITAYTVAVVTHKRKPDEQI